jgi:hypothetical protein
MEQAYSAGVFIFQEKNYKSLRARPFAGTLFYS